MAAVDPNQLLPCGLTPGELVAQLDKMVDEFKPHKAAITTTLTVHADGQKMRTKMAMVNFAKELRDMTMTAHAHAYGEPVLRLTAPTGAHAARFGRARPPPPPAPRRPRAGGAAGGVQFASPASGRPESASPPARKRPAPAPLARTAAPRARGGGGGGGAAARPPPPPAGAATVFRRAGTGLGICAVYSLTMSDGTVVTIDPLSETDWTVGVPASVLAEAKEKVVAMAEGMRMAEAKRREAEAARAAAAAGGKR